MSSAGTWPSTCFAAYRDGPAPVEISESGHLILDIIQDTFPTEALTRAYFENLDSLLEQRPVRRTPGTIVIGIGSGRNGSTSLAGLLSTIEGSCCTHENPPLMCWTPRAEETRFHTEAAPTACMNTFPARRRRRALVAQRDPEASVMASRIALVIGALHGMPKLCALVLEDQGCRPRFLQSLGTVRQRHLVGGTVGSDVSDLSRPGPRLGGSGRREAPTRDALRREYNASGGSTRHAPAHQMSCCAQDGKSQAIQTAQRALYEQVGADGAIKTVRLNVGT